MSIDGKQQAAVSRHQLIERRQARQFWVLAVFFCLVSATGGSTWSDEPHLMVLRPLAILVAGYGLATMQPEDWRRYRSMMILFGAAFALTLLHLVPLPAQIWQHLPGREIIVEIDSAAGLGDIWRPLSMVPEATWNAAYALSVPVAVLLLAVQLGEAMHRRLLLVLIALASISAAISIMQLAGAGWHHYSRQTPLAGLFINRNHQALLLDVAILSAAVWAAVKAASDGAARVARFISVTIAVILVPVIILMGSRAGVMIAGFALACMPLFWTSEAKVGEGDSDRDARRRRLVAAGWIGLVLIVGIFWYAITSSRDSAFDRLQEVGFGLRLPVWSSIVEMIGHYMPWGTGIGSYAEVYQILEPNELLRRRYSNHAHSDWLEIAFTAGFPGILISLAAAWLLLRAAKRSFAYTGVSTLYNRLGVLAIFMLAIASAADYPVRTPILSAILALAAVWAVFGQEAGQAIDAD